MIGLYWHYKTRKDRMIALRNRNKEIRYLQRDIRDGRFESAEQAAEFARGIMGPIALQYATEDEIVHLIKTLKKKAKAKKHG